MNETMLDLREIIRIIKGRSRIIVSVFLAVVMAAAVINILLPPTFEATTTLRIKQPKGLGSSLLDDLPVSNGNSKQLMSTYAELVKSRTVVQSVIDKTQQDKEKVPEYEELLKTISTEPVRDTEILKIRVQAKSPAEAQYVANTLVATFIDRLTYMVRSEQTAVREFIGQRLGEAKQELQQAESVLEAYKREQKIVAPADETKALVDRLSDINKLAAENTVGLVASQAKLSSTEHQLANEKQGFVADSPLVQQLKSKLAELEVQLASSLQKYTNKHPEIIAIRAAIAETKLNLASEVGRIVNAEAPSMNPIHQGLLQSRIQADAELAAAAAQQTAISGIIAAGEQELTKLPTKEQGLARVMRDVMVAEQIYIMLAQRHEEARISEVMTPTDVQVVDIAIVPQGPVKPNKMLNVLIAALLGLLAGLGVAFALDRLNRTIRTTEDVKHVLDLPVLGNIPDFSNNGHTDKSNLLTKIKSIMDTKATEAGRAVSQRKLIVYEQGKSLIAEAFRTLRTNLQFAKVDSELKVIMFTSTAQGEGKSTTAANAAVTLAQTGKQVLLIDCDLRKPVQHHIFALKNTGLTNALAGVTPVEQLVQQTAIENLRLLASGPIPVNPSELLGSVRMQAIITGLKSQADYLIIDAPPAVAVTDACVLASKTDGIVFVLKSGMVRPKMAQKAKELLQRANGDMVGVLLNQVELEATDACYYYYNADPK